MTCRQLGGACDLEFAADTFEEIAKLSQAHANEMMMAQDAEHLAAMSAMSELMKTPGAMATWMQEKRNLFDSFEAQ